MGSLRGTVWGSNLRGMKVLMLAIAALVLGSSLSFATESKGTIEKSRLEDAIKQHIDEFRLCYEERTMKGGAPDSGKVVTIFTIGPEGRVTQAGIKSTSLKDPEIETCLVSVLKRTRFPKPNHGAVEVTYPFEFSSTRK